VCDARNPGYPVPKDRRPEETRRIFQTGAVHSGVDRIRYTSQPDLAAMLAEAGLRLDRWMGD